MKTGIRKVLSLVSAAALAATTIATSVFVSYAEPEQPDRYNYQISTSEATLADAAEGAAIGNTNGVWSIYKDGAVTSGSLIYYSELPITDYLFKTIEANSSLTYGTITYYASTNGEEDSWVAIDPVDVEGETHNGGWQTSHWTHYGQFAAEEDIHYLRADIAPVSSLFPGVEYVQCNVIYPDSYAETKSPADEDVVKSDPEKMYHDVWNGTDIGYTFTEDGTAGANDNNGAPGSFVFSTQEEKYITDLVIDGAQADNGFGGTLKFYYSPTGEEESYREFSPVRIVTGDSVAGQSSSWGGAKRYDFYYQFDAADKIRFIKVELVKEEGSFKHLPAVRSIKYNFEISDNAFEAQYAYTIPANDSSVNGADSLVESEVLAAVDPDTKYYGFTKQVTVGEDEDAETVTQGTGGTLDFKADAKYFTDVCVKAAVGPGDTISFYKSVDSLFNMNEDPFKVSDVSVRKIADLPDGGSLNYYYFTLPVSEEIRYIRVQLTKGADDTSVGLPAVASLMYNGLDAIEYEYRIGAGDYFDYSTEEGASFIQNSGVYHFNKDGSSVDGTVTYKSDYVISQFNIRILKSDAPSWAGDFTYWVSETGEDDSWVQLLPEDAENPDGNPVYKTQAISKHSNTGWDSSYCNIYGDLDTSGNYHYIQIRADINNATSFPLGPQYVQFNTEDDPESYDYTVNPSQAYEIVSESGTLTNFEGVYLFHDESGADTAGTVTFAAPYYFEDFSLRVVMPNANQCDASIHFEAYTADGTLVEDFKPMISRDRRHNTGWGSAYFDVSGKLDESDGVKYIRVVFDGGGTRVMPAITQFQYNLPGQPNYTETQTPDQNVGIESEGDFVTDVPEISGYYLFHSKTEKTEDGDPVAVPGTIAFYSELAITDYNFQIVEGANYYGGQVTYSASVDGETWEPVTDYAVLVTGVVNSSWGPGQTKNVYGAFSPDDDIHYLRVELNNTGFWKQPALKCVNYNMDGVIRPDIYRYQQSAQDAAADSEGTLTATAADSEYFNFQQNGSVVEGSLVFEADNFYSDLSINMLNGDEAEFYYSADGTEWTAFVPEVEADGNYAEYYTKFPTGKVARFIRVDLKGDAAISGIVYNTGTRYYEQLPASDDIDNLELPTKVSDFASGSYGDSIFKLSGMTITNNGSTNGPYIGGDLGNYGMVQTSQDSEIIFYTPGMKDFTFISAYPGDGIENIQYKAYGRKTQYGEETEIPLMRVEIRDAGFDHSKYRPTEEARETLDDYLYLRIEAKIESANMVQLLNFTFFYDGEEPGPVPDDEHAGGEGTDRTNVKTYNFIKGNMNPLRSENMVAVTNTIGNVDYIGTEQGYLVETEGQDGFVTFRTDGITYFYVKVHMIPEYVGNLKVKILVAPEDDDSQYVEIPLKYELTADQPTGWISVEYMPADGAVIPAGSNYIKYLIEEGDTSSQLVRIDYEYEVSEVQRLPDWTEPDTANNQKELLDRFEGNGITTAQGGLAYDAFQMSILGSYNLGGENGSARVIAKDNPFSDGSVYYQVDADIDSIDVRGYRIVGFEDLPLVWVSADGEDWTLLEDGEALTVPLFDGPQEFSWQLSNIPDGMRYVRVDIPDLENSTDLVLHGIQILYGSGSIDNVDTGVALPLAALALAGASGAAVLVSRKRRRSAK